MHICTCYREKASDNFIFFFRVQIRKQLVDSIIFTKEKKQRDLIDRCNAMVNAIYML
jgi:hypothetical protein